MDLIETFFDRLWQDYSSINPQAGKIMQALRERGETVVNDHVAFRTFEHPKLNIDVLGTFFENNGYRISGEVYEFPQKKLKARHFDPPGRHLPKVFISALCLESFSAGFRRTLQGLIDQVPPDAVFKDDFLLSGAAWAPIDSGTYKSLLEESEYGAWLAAFGFRANHFTVSFNDLHSFESLAQLSDFIRSLGFELNCSGGEIKGSPQQLLEQSSTRACPVQVAFADEKKQIPGCYYEFARRYPQKDGRLFGGFVPRSADRLFESTDSGSEKKQED